MLKRLLLVTALLSLASPGIAQDTHTQVTPDAIVWKSNPAFPKEV